MESRGPICAIDVFCGCGGMTRGLLDAGIDVRLGIDLDWRARETYENNNRPAEFWGCDISQVTGKEIAYYAGIGPSDPLVLAGCAPCQPFSKLHKGKLDDRAELIGQFGRLVGELVPDAIVLENVPGLRHQSQWTSFISKLRDMRYLYEVRVLDAQKYGVPQRRRRLVLLAGKGFPVRPPSPTHGVKAPAVERYRTVRDAIESFPPIAAGENCPSLPNHKAATLSPLNLRRIKQVKADGGSRTSLPAKLALRCHKFRNGRVDKMHHTDTYGRMQWDLPAPTLTTKCTSLTNGRFGHPVQHRAISVREAAALQTFPLRYSFPDEIIRPTLWIGNAVPPRLARVLGEGIVAAMKGGAQQALTSYVTPQALRD